MSQTERPFDLPMLKSFINPLPEKLKKKSVFNIRDNIWGAYLAHMQLINKFKKDLDFYYMLLIFLGNMPGLLLQKIKKV